MSCPDCLTGDILPGEPTGAYSIQGAYLAQAPSSSRNPDRAILLLTDAFGLSLKNSKVLADKFATELKCDVWVPDYFEGRPLADLDSMYLLPDRSGVKMTLFKWLRFILAMIPKLPAAYSSRSSVVDARLSKFITAIIEEKKYQKLGAVGYCFGGSTAIRLGSASLVQSIVICHPGPFSIEQAKAIKVPSSWVCAEGSMQLTPISDDLFFGRKYRLKVEASFAERQGTGNFVDYEFKDYEGTAHGFAARPNLSLTKVTEAHKKAFQQAVDWFSKTLTPL